METIYFVLPAYNEEANIEEVIAQWHPVCEQINAEGNKAHLVIANDGSKDKTTRRFLSFYAVGLTGLGISELMLYLMVTLGGMNELLCKLISIVVVALIQFVLNKFITFRK